MMVCAELRVGFPDALTLSTLHNGEEYVKTFFGGLISTTVPTSTAPAWDPAKTDYQIGDVVYIEELKTEFVCGEVGNMEYPPASAMWDARTANDYRQIDNIPTTKSLSETDIVNVYDTAFSTHIVGQFIDGVDTVTAEALDDNMEPTGNTLATVKMTKVIDYTCFSCCNPPLARKRFFLIDLSAKRCTERFVKLTLTKHKSASHIRIGTIAPVRAIAAGQLGKTTIHIDNGIDFQRTKITKDIHAVNIGATIKLDGSARIKPADKKRLYERMMEYQGLTFTMLDTKELAVLDGVVMGKFTTPDGLDVGLSFDSTYQFETQGVLA